MGSTRYIDITPTPTEYARQLCAIIQSGRSVDAQWAIEQVCKAFRAAASLNPDAWGKEPEHANRS